MKKVLALILALCIGTGMTACSDQEEKTEVQVFAAASLRLVMEELAKEYEQEHPNEKIVIHTDSSGTLLNQIREGYECDIFFPAAEKQMDELEAEGLVVEGTRADVVRNKVVLITWKGSGTKVTGLDNLEGAKSIALAGGSVPVGKYTREALVHKEILESTEAVSEITTAQISDALGGVEISEQDNVSKVLISVAEGSCEVGTTYESDLYGYEEKVEILERVSEELTGEVRYPICQVKNSEADQMQTKAAEAFLKFVRSDKAKEVFETYQFEINKE